jgi:hypothetical protein
MSAAINTNSNKPFPSGVEEPSPVLYDALKHPLSILLFVYCAVDQMIRKFTNA